MGVDAASTRLTEVVLRSPDPEASRRFVGASLGALADPPPWPGTVALRFSQGASPTDGRGDVVSPFWKISVFADDVDRLRASLTAAGAEVSEPVQFGDIGYLCHLREPGGNEIELLQRRFRHSPPLDAASPDTLGLITLRIGDLEASTSFYRDGLGMRPLATMTVDGGRPDPFDLHFYGYVDEPRPHSDLTAVVNREWLYQRRTTVVELQHYHRPSPRIDDAEVGVGLDHVRLVTDDLEALVRSVEAAGFEARAQENEVHGVSPDGHRFVCVGGG